MPNTLLTSSVITQEALVLLELNLGFSKNVNREYDSSFAVEGAKIGTSLNIRKPVRYVGRTGATASTEDILEEQTTITLDKQFGVDMTVTTAELTLEIDQFSKRCLSPAVARIAHEVDRDGLAEYVNVYNAVGTPGTVPNALLTYLSATPKLDNAGAPRDENRWMCISSFMEITIVDALKALFNATDEISKQYLMGRMGRASGYLWLMDQNVQVHTVGTYAGTPLVDGADQEGTSLITDGWTSGASELLAGDIFTIAGVYSVKPHTRESTGALQQFRVTADISDTAGAKTIVIDPPITTSGPYQTVTGSPADDAAITVLGAAGAVGQVGLAYHRDAFTLAMADLYTPSGTDMAGRAGDKQLGLSIRFVRDYQITSDSLLTRLDVLYGWDTIRPELACRVMSGLGG